MLCITERVTEVTTVLMMEATTGRSSTSQLRGPSRVHVRVRGDASCGNRREGEAATSMSPVSAKPRESGGHKSGIVGFWRGAKLTVGLVWWMERFA